MDFASGNRARAEARGAIVRHQVCGQDQDAERSAFLVFEEGDPGGRRHGWAAEREEWK